MRLTEEKYRLCSRSTAEMTVEQLSLLKLTLESSVSIARYESEHRPERGAKVFGFIPLLMLYILMECRRSTYKGIVKNLSDHDCACLGMPFGKDGRFRRPPAATLNEFVNLKLLKAVKDLGWEIAAAMIANDMEGIITIDSTPVQASRYNRDADYSLHYEIRMDKAHMIMLNGRPLFMILSEGNAGDSPFAAPLISSFASAGSAGGKYTAYSDGSYDCYKTYAQVYMTLGTVMVCNQGEGSVLSGVDAAAIRKQYGKMWRTNGYDPHKKNDTEFMLRFLYRNGKEELVGKYVRDISMTKNPDADPRHLCETIHRAVKRWIEFTIFGIKKATKTIRMRCRFLCIQLLSTLFIGYTI